MLKEEFTGTPYSQWESRSRIYGPTLKGVLFGGMPGSVNRHFHKWQTEMVLESISVGGNPTILDVGCGYGRISIEIKRRLPKACVIGMDVSNYYIKMYKETTQCSGFIGEVQNIPSRYGRFDYIVCVTVLMYLDKADLAAGISSLLRHLKPGGKLILIENDYSGQRVQMASRLLSRMKKQRSRGYTGGRCFRKNELDNLIKRTGGKILFEKRLPATTVCLIPMWAIGTLLADRALQPLLDKIALLDKRWENFDLPSIYIARVIVNESQGGPR